MESKRNDKNRFIEAQQKLKGMFQNINKCNPALSRDPPALSREHTALNRQPLTVFEEAKHDSAVVDDHFDVGYSFANQI